MSDDTTRNGSDPKPGPRARVGDEPTLLDASSATDAQLPNWTLGLGTTQLRAGTRLHEYEVTGTIGQGGFGIVYRAVDRNMGLNVAIKEYLPATMALRSDSGGVTLASQAHADAFELGLSSFVNEARLLAKFDHPSLVKAFRFWEANGTAYMVMPLYEGVTLKQYALDHPDISQRWLEQLLDPLLEALETLHRARVFHRDIAPDNILILKDGRPLLLDFGAARQKIGEATHGMTVIVKPGYAPIEQYTGDASARQGAWTDIYALAAVMYFVITRKVPPPSVSRVVEDTLEPLARLRPKGFAQPFLEALDRALRVEHKQRPQSVPEFRALLKIVHGTRDTSPPGPPKPESNMRMYSVAIALGFLALVAIVWRITHPSQIRDHEIAVEQPVTQPPPRQELEIQPPPNPAPPPTVRPQFSARPALREVAGTGNPGMAPTVTVPRPRAVADHDRVEFSVKSHVDGYLYVLMYDTDGKLYLLFPNAIDKNNRIATGAELRLPTREWSIVATPPYGVNRLLAIVSQTPREFKSVGLIPAGDFNEFRLDVAQNLYAKHQEAWPFLAGRPVCAQPCAGAFGAAEFTVEVVRK